MERIARFADQTPYASSDHSGPFCGPDVGIHPLEAGVRGYHRSRRGANCGWPRHEGFEGGAGFEKPIFAYKHDSLPRTPPATWGCAITGGAFYYPPAGASTPFPEEYRGDYFFEDFCNGWIRKLDADGNSVVGFASGASFPADLKVGPDGGLYYLELGGSVRVIRPS